MPFQRNHLYLTIHWRPVDYPLETGQCGIRFDQPITEPTQALADACKPAVQALWTAAGSKISSGYALMFVRLARISVDGTYVAGSRSFDGVYAAPVTGTGVDGNTLQTACASTLTTGVPHGQASKGRLFLPPINNGPNVAGDHLWPIADVNARSNSVATMMIALNAVLGGPGAIFSKGTVRGGGPLVRSVVGVETGRRPDVQRRRAKGQPDPRGANSVVTGVLAP